MKKLRCTSCNGALELDENKEYARCKFCDTLYKLDKDDDNNINLGAVVKPEKVSIAFKVVFVLVIAVFIIVFISIFNTISNFGNFTDYQPNVSNKSKESADKFNFPFSNGSGTKYSVFIESTLNDVNESNKKNDIHKINVVYKDIDTQDEDEINKIKHSLDSYKEYEVKYYYDDLGYLNKIVIEDIE